MCQAARFVASAPAVRHPWGVPVYMDRHNFVSQTPAEVAAAHLKDLEVQAQFGVQFLTYWFDYERQTAFCLARAGDAGDVEAAHRAAHGAMPHVIVEVDPRTVERFAGGIVEHPPGEAYVDSAFRTILFTDIEGSTALTQRLGDAAAMTVLHAHDETVRAALGRHAGSEVKHTGDGLMASFRSVSDGIGCAVEIQRALAGATDGSAVPVRIRIGIAAGEPVTQGGDLFGAAVQLAARLCSRAEPGGILVSGAVRDLALGKGFDFRKRPPLRLKGFADRVQAFEVGWQR